MHCPPCLRKTGMRECSGEKHPMNFGRDVLAQLAGVPGRADWKACKKGSGAEEEAAAQAFQKFYEPFR